MFCALTHADISKLHSEAAGMGTDSPGPGAYKHESFDPADVSY